MNIEHDELLGIMLPSDFYRALIELRKNIQSAQRPVKESFGDGHSSQL